MFLYLIDRRSYKSEEAIQVPNDVKVEVWVGLVLLFLATIIMFTRDNREIAMNHQTAHKTEQQVFNRRNMRMIRRTRSHLHNHDSSETRVPACDEILKRNPKLASLGRIGS